MIHSPSIGSLESSVPVPVQAPVLVPASHTLVPAPVPAPFQVDNVEVANKVEGRQEIYDPKQWYQAIAWGSNVVSPRMWGFRRGSVR